MLDKEQSLLFGLFNKGLITRIADTEIPDDSMSNVQNIELDEKFLPTKSKGHVKYESVSPLAYPIRGAFVYRLSNGTTYYIKASGGKLYYSVSGTGTWTAYQIGGNDLTITENSDVEMVQYLDCVWIVNNKYPIITNVGYATSRMIKISGITPSEIILANVPQGGKYIIVHQERIFIAGSIDEPSGIYWSEPFDPEDWTPEYGLNYDFVGKDDGENITGIKSYQGYIYVGKPHNLYRYMTLGDITQWQSIRVDTNKGWLYHRTIQEFFGYLIYLSPEGVCQFDGANVNLLSEQIRDKILELPQMVDNKRQWLQSTTTDFDTGTVPSVLDTSDNELKEKIITATLGDWLQTTIADWDAGTKGNQILDTSNNELKLLPQNTEAQYDAGIYTNLSHSHRYGTIAISFPDVTLFPQLTGNYLSQTLDFGNAPLNFGHLRSESFVPSGTTMTLKTQSSDDGISWDAEVSLITGVIQSVERRYLRWKVYFTRDNYSLFPWIRNIYCGGMEWYSAKKNIGRLDSYRPFFTNYNKKTETLDIFYRTARTSVGLDTATWYPIDKFQVPADGLLGSDIWVQLKVGFDTNNYANQPVLYDMTFRYYVLDSPLTFDYKIESPTSFGNLVSNATGNITFYSKSSATDLAEDETTGWYAAAGWTVVTAGVIGSTVHRYMRLKIITTYPSTLTQLSLGAEFRSVEKDLGVTPTSWGNFESAYILNSQSITWWLRSKATSPVDTAWVQQIPGIPITGVTLARYIQWEARINTTNFIQQPSIDSVLISYFLTTQLLSPCSIVWKNNYWLNVIPIGGTINAVVFKYNKDGYWLYRTNKYNNIYFIDGEKLFSGTSETDGFVRQNEVGLKDDTTDIDSFIETKNFEIMAFIKLFRRLYLASKSNANWTISYSIDSGDYINITVKAQTYVKTINKVLSGLNTGRFIKLKISQSAEDEMWEFHGGHLMYQTLRRLNIEE